MLFFGYMLSYSNIIFAITYNEAVDGDLNAPTTYFLLEEGINSISGIQVLEVGPEPPYATIDQDNFLITIPEQTSALFSFDYFIDVVQGTNYIAFEWEMRKVITDDCNVLCANTYEPYATGIFKSQEFDVNIPDRGAINFNDITSLSSGNYFFSLGSITKRISGTSSELVETYALNYSVTLDIKPVPIPPSLLLFLSGLPMLLLLAKKHSKN